MSLREIEERVGLHYSAVGNAIQRVRENPTRKVAKSLRELELKPKNQETPGTFGQRPVGVVS